MTDREDVLILYIPAKRLVSRSQWYAMRTAQDVHHIFFRFGAMYGYERTSGKRPEAG